MTPLINGRAYDYAQIVATVLGTVFPSISAIEYGETQEKENNFGAGDRPVSRGHGAKNATCKLTLSMNDIEAIRRAIPTGSLLDVPAFDIVVTFLNEALPVTHVVKNCEFTNDMVSGAQNDKDLKTEFELIPSHIIWR